MFDRVVEIPDSSWVQTIRYDADALVLDMILHSGKRYRYDDVPAETFARVVTADSVGAAINEHLKPLGPARRIPGARGGARGPAMSGDSRQDY